MYSTFLKGKVLVPLHIHLPEQADDLIASISSYSLSKFSTITTGLLSPAIF